VIGAPRCLDVHGSGPRLVRSRSRGAGGGRTLGRPAGLALALLVLAGALLGVMGVGTGRAGAQAAATTGRGCSRVDVLLMIDQSASLKNTDTRDERVAAAEVLLRSLASSAEAGGTTIDVTVAAFGTEALEVGRATLPGGITGAVDIVRPFADRETDLNTDYVLALSFAVRHFQAVTDLSAECKRMVWFTDGAYSIDQPNAAGIAGYTTSTNRDAIVGELAGQICGGLPETSRLPAPLSQQIRQAGFYVQLVDLRSGGNENDAERRDRESTAPVIDRLLSGDANDGCAVPGGRVEATNASTLATEFFTQGQIALGRVEVDCPALAAGYPSPLVRAVTVRGASPDQPLVVRSGGQQLASGTGFVTWVLPATGGAPPGPTVTAAAADGSPVGGCYADLSASIVPVGSQRIEPKADSTTLSWAVLGVGAGARSVSDAAARLGPDVVGMTAKVDGVDTPVTWDDASRTWQVVVPGPVEQVPVVVVAANTTGWGQLTAVSSNIEEGASMAPPRVAWNGPTRFEGTGTFGGRIGVVPAPVPEGAAIPDGVVCIQFGTPAASSPAVSLTVAEPLVCHPAGEPFEVNTTVVVTDTENATVQAVVPYTVTHRPAGAPEDLVVSTGQAELPSFSLVKAADAVTIGIYGIVIVLLSALVPLGLLILLINLQRRLPSPSSMVVARVALLSVGGELRRIEGTRVTTFDLQKVEGTRSEYRLPWGLTVWRPVTYNPFAATTVEAGSDTGSVTAVPWMAPGAGRSVQVPAGFTDLVLIRSDPGSTEAEAVVILPASSSAADDADRAVSHAVAVTNRTWTRVNDALGSFGL
jgi:hypothetical protein